MSDLITGLFETRLAAENAVTLLKQRGYTANEISIIVKDDGSHSKHTITHPGSYEDQSATSVVPASHHSTAMDAGSIGALLGGLMAVTTIIVPGIGLLTAGALAALFVGGGALAGSAIGWLIEQGIPADIAPYYERGLHEGGVVIAVAAHSGDEANIYAILHGGAVAYVGGGTASYVAPALATRHNDLTLPLPNLAHSDFRKSDSAAGTSGDNSGGVLEK